MFWAQGGQNEPNGSKSVPINMFKIFHEHDVNDVKKNGIKCFWAQDIKISHKHDEHDHWKAGIKCFGHRVTKMCQMAEKLSQLM